MKKERKKKIENNQTMEIKKSKIENMQIMRRRKKNEEKEEEEMTSISFNTYDE